MNRHCWASLWVYCGGRWSPIVRLRSIPDAAMPRRQINTSGPQERRGGADSRHTHLGGCQIVDAAGGGNLRQRLGNVSKPQAEAATDRSVLLSIALRLQQYLR